MPAAEKGEVGEGKKGVGAWVLLLLLTWHCWGMVLWVAREQDCVPCTAGASTDVWPLLPGFGMKVVWPCDVLVSGHGNGMTLVKPGCWEPCVSKSPAGTVLQVPSCCTL